MSHDATNKAGVSVMAIFRQPIVAVVAVVAVVAIGVQWKNSARREQVAQQKERNDTELRELKKNKDAEEKQLAAEVAIRQKEALKANYVGARYQKTRTTAALVALANDGTHDVALSERLARVLSESGIESDWRVFRAEFIASDYFKKIITGANVDRADFNAGEYCSYLIVTKHSVRTRTIHQPAEMVVADLTLSLQVISAADGDVKSTFEVVTHGPGFVEADARQLALEKAEQEIKKLAPKLSERLMATK